MVSTEYEGERKSVYYGRDLPCIGMRVTAVSLFPFDVPRRKNITDKVETYLKSSRGAGAKITGKTMIPPISKSVHGNALASCMFLRR